MRASLGVYSTLPAEFARRTLESTAVFDVAGKCDRQHKREVLMENHAIALLVRRQINGDMASATDCIGDGFQQFPPWTVEMIDHTQQLIRLAESFLQKPGHSLPQRCSSWRRRCNYCAGAITISRKVNNALERRFQSVRSKALLGIDTQDISRRPCNSHRNIGNAPVLQ